MSFFNERWIEHDTDSMLLWMEKKSSAVLPMIHVNYL